MATQIDMLEENLVMVQNDLASLNEKAGAHEAQLRELNGKADVIASNYATREALAITNGKIDVLAANLQALQARVDLSFTVFATKEELATAVYQLTWRMAAFGSLLFSGGFFIARYV